MNLKKILPRLLLISLLLSLLAFVLDLNERVPDLVTNLTEIGILTGLLFLTLSMLTLPALALLRRTRTKSR